MGYKRGRTIMRFCDEALLSRKLTNPIDFPGLAAVRRERLLHVRRLGRNIEPDIAHKNGASFVFLLIEKLTAIPGKASDHGRQTKSPLVEIDEIDAPLMRSGIVEAQRLCFDVKLLISAGHVELFEVRVAVEKLLVVRDSVVLDPDIGFIKTIRQPANVRFPVADEEVKVVRTIALRQICRIGRRLPSKRNSERHAERHD